MRPIDPIFIGMATETKIFVGP